MNSSAMMSPMTTTRRLEKPSMRPRRRSLRSASPGSGWTERANFMGDLRLRDDPVHGLVERVGDEIRLEARLRMPLLVRPVPRADQNRSCTDRPGQSDVDPLVADDERPRRIEPERARRTIDQAG